MSYCRFGPDSDLYVIASYEGYRCISCRLSENHSDWCTESLEKLYHHLMDHLSAGHEVPMSAFDRVLTEIQNNVMNEFNQIKGEMLARLLFKFSASNDVFKYFVQTGQLIHDLDEDFWDAMQGLEDLDWPKD